MQDPAAHLIKVFAVTISGALLLLCIWAVRNHNRKARIEEIESGLDIGKRKAWRTEIESGLDIGLLRKMALECYGYGRWDAPYWFIGLGEGIGPAAGVHERAEAWSELQCEGLCDCRSFHLHKLVGEARFHLDPVRLESTWRPLMLLLKTFLGEKQIDQVNLRRYQSDCWGIKSCATCVVELFGLPATNFGAYKALMAKLFTQAQIEEILQKRIDFLRKKIRENTPRLVVMYGYTAEEQWRKIVKLPMVKDKPFRMNSTIVIWTKHPTAPNKEGDAYWRRLGNDCADFGNR